jgi:hypothetical protein
MPSINGYELVEKITRDDLNIKVCFMPSGETPKPCTILLGVSAALLESPQQMITSLDVSRSLPASLLDVFRRLNLAKIEKLVKDTKPNYQTNKHTRQHKKLLSTLVFVHFL